MVQQQRHREVFATVDGNDTFKSEAQSMLYRRRVHFVLPWENVKIAQRDQGANSMGGGMDTQRCF